MFEKDVKKLGYSSQLAVLLGLTGAGLIISLIASLLIWLMMVGASMPETIEEILQPKYYKVNMVLQAVSTFFIFFIPAYCFALISYRNAQNFLGFNIRFNARQVFFVIAILILTFPLSGALSELTKLLPIPQSWEIKFKAMEAAREAQEATLIQINSFPKYLVSLFIIALLPAIFEETYFRAGMQGLFTRWFNGPWAAIIVTSLIFSVIHLSFYGFVVRFGLGVILGLVFYYSGSLWLSVIFHFLFNGIQVTMLYIMYGSGAKQAKDLEKSFPIWTGAIALVLLYYLFREFKRISINQQGKYVEKQIPANDFQDWAANQKN